MNGTISTTGNQLSAFPQPDFDNITLGIFSNQINFPPGTVGSFLILINVYGSLNNILGDPVFGFNGCRQTSSWKNETLQWFSNAGVNAANYFYQTVVTATSGDMFITLTNGTYPVSPTAGDIFVLQVNDLLV